MGKPCWPLSTPCRINQRRFDSGKRQKITTWAHLRARQRQINTKAALGIMEEY